MTTIQKHIVFLPLCFAALLALCSGLVMLLWNYLMPEIFCLPELSFWQSMALLLLCKLLFGGILAGHHGVHGHHGHHGHCCNGDKNKLRERWENMSKEEREHLMKMHGCCIEGSEKLPVNE